MNNTIAIVIAAGVGSRLRPLTDDLPKCMLTIDGKPLLQHAAAIFRSSGISRIMVIGGYRAERLRLPEGASLILNSEYQHNNILHSLAYGREAMVEADTVLVAYSDIIFKQSVVEDLLAVDQEDIAIVVDQAWQQGYASRPLHPLQEAEGANFGPDGDLRGIGKKLLTNQRNPAEWGEFIGMMKLTHKGNEVFWDTFDKIDSQLLLDGPFQQAAAWKNAYLTDLLQEIVDCGTEVHCSLIRGGWQEIDTSDDYEEAQAFDFGSKS